jgi:hypothetical protein
MWGELKAQGTTIIAPTRTSCLAQKVIITITHNDRLNLNLSPSHFNFVVILVDIVVRMYGMERWPKVKGKRR